MIELARRCYVAILTYTSLYVLLRFALGVESIADLPYDFGLTWVVWVIWSAWFAGGDVLSILSGWRTRRTARRTPARPVPLAEYMPGSTSPQPRVNRAA